VAEDVVLHEVHLDSFALGPRTRFGDRNGRVVDAADAPAAFGEPDRVLALAAGEVERAAGLELRHLGDEEAVRLRAP
jgi:hypothetical protein